MRTNVRSNLVQCRQRRPRAAPLWRHLPPAGEYLRTRIRPPLLTLCNHRNVSNKSSISTGAIAGIAIAAIVAFLSAVIVLFGLWKRRQAHVKLINGPKHVIDESDLPTNALRTSPFTSEQDLTEGTRSISACECGIM